MIPPKALKYAFFAVKARVTSSRSEAQPRLKRGGERGSRARPLGGLGERTLSSSKSEFVSNFVAPELNPSQTFEIILQNLTHKTKKQNLK